MLFLFLNALNGYIKRPIITHTKVIQKHFALDNFLPLNFNSLSKTIQTNNDTSGSEYSTANVQKYLRLERKHRKKRKKKMK